MYVGNVKKKGATKRTVDLKILRKKRDLIMLLL